MHPTLYQCVFVCLCVVCGYPTGDCGRVGNDCLMSRSPLRCCNHFANDTGSSCGHRYKAKAEACSPSSRIVAVSIVAVVTISRNTSKSRSAVGFGGRSSSSIKHKSRGMSSSCRVVATGFHARRLPLSLRDCLIMPGQSTYGGRSQLVAPLSDAEAGKQTEDSSVQNR